MPTAQKNSSLWDLPRHIYVPVFGTVFLKKNFQVYYSFSKLCKSQACNLMSFHSLNNNSIQVKKQRAIAHLPPSYPLPVWGRVVFHSKIDHRALKWFHSSLQMAMGSQKANTDLCLAMPTRCHMLLSGATGDVLPTTPVAGVGCVEISGVVFLF